MGAIEWYRVSLRPQTYAQYLQGSKFVIPNMKAAQTIYVGCFQCMHGDLIRSQDVKFRNALAQE